MTCLCVLYIDIVFVHCQNRSCELSREVNKMWRQSDHRALFIGDIHQMNLSRTCCKLFVPEVMGRPQSILLPKMSFFVRQKTQNSSKSSSKIPDFCQPSVWTFIATFLHNFFVI